MPCIRGYTILGPLLSSLRVSAAVEAAPDIRHESLSMAGQRGDVTVTSNAAGFPLSHPAMPGDQGQPLGKRDTQIYQHPHLATTSSRSGTHWAPNVNLSPWKGPLTAMKVNEGLI